MSHDTDNPIELYAWSVSQIQVAKEPGMLEGRVINPDSGRWEGVSTHSRTIEALKRERRDQTAPSIANQDATPRDLDSDMLCDLNGTSQRTR